MMNQAYLEFVAILGWLAIAGAAGLLVRMVFRFVIRDRLTSGIAPSLNEGDGGTFFHRLIALVGMNGPVTRTIDSYRLRTSIGLRLFCWGIVGLIVWYAAKMESAATGGMSPDSDMMTWAVILAAVWTALWNSLYEVSFDRETVTLPTFWFSRRTFRWRDLEAVTRSDSWMLTFHFRGGRRMQVHKFVVGYPLLMEAAQKALRED